MPHMICYQGNANYNKNESTTQALEWPESETLISIADRDVEQQVLSIGGTNTNQYSYYGR
jgi:hypothetical protein